VHNVRLHEAHIIEFFSDPKREPHATLDELEEIVRVSMKSDLYSREQLLMAIDILMTKKHTIQRKDMLGYVVYRSNMYMFQPAGSPAGITIEERDGRVEGTEHSKALVRFMPPTSSAHDSSIRGLARRTPSSTSKSSSVGSRSALSSRMPERWDASNVIDSLERRIMQFAMRLPWNENSEYRDVLVDWVVDRLKTKELLDTCLEALHTYFVGGVAKSAGAVLLNSLVSGGVL
jgi:hypothetical protein